eukprot:577799-Amphidinium_carterae.1
MQPELSSFSSTRQDVYLAWRNLTRFLGVCVDDQAIPNFCAVNLHYCGAIRLIHGHTCACQGVLQLIMLTQATLQAPVLLTEQSLLNEQKDILRSSNSCVEMLQLRAEHHVPLELEVDLHRCETPHIPTAVALEMYYTLIWNSHLVPARLLNGVQDLPICVWRVSKEVQQDHVLELQTLGLLNR